MSRKLWVRLDSENFNQPTQVPALLNDNVDDFKVAIKTKLQLPNPPHEMTLHLTENADAMDCDDLLPAINRKDTALIVKVVVPKLVSMAYGKATMDYFVETTGVQPALQLWDDIPVDTALEPSLEFVELFKKTCSVFQIVSEASRRTIIDLFLREIVSLFPEFQIICEYPMTIVNVQKQLRLNGKCDYTVSRRGFPHLPHLAAGETKSVNDEFMNQVIGECSSIYYRRKVAGMENCRVYGFHSTGKVWAFIFIDDDGVIHVSDDYTLNVKKYVKEDLDLIYRLVHFVIHQSFLNSPRTTPIVSTSNVAD